jgi:hypothetical protein
LGGTAATPAHLAAAKRFVFSDNIDNAVIGALDISQLTNSCQLRPLTATWDDS